MSEVLVWQLIAVACGTSAVAALLLLFLLWRRMGRAEQAAATVQNDLRALCNAAVTVGERMNQVERQIRQLAQRQEELGLRQEQLDYAEPQERSFQQAAKLIQKGTGVEEVMDICGLTRGEAELIAMMNRLSTAG